MSPIDYILCLGHFLEKDEDVYKFFEPEFPLDLGYPRTTLPDPTKSPSLEKKAPQKPTASKAGSKSAKELSEKKLANGNQHQNGALNGKGKTMAVEEKNMWSVLHLDRENYFSCAVGRSRTSAKYTLKSPGDIVLFLSCMAAGNYEVGSESESESSLRN